MQPPQPNLLQVQPEIDQELLELAFSESPAADINALMQILGHSDPGVLIQALQLINVMMTIRFIHFVIQGGNMNNTITRKTRP